MSTGQAKLRHSVGYYCDTAYNIIQKYYFFGDEDAFLNPVLALEQVIRGGDQLSAEEMAVVTASMDDLISLCPTLRIAKELEHDLAELRILKAALPEGESLTPVEDAILREVNAIIFDLRSLSKEDVAAGQKLLHGRIEARLSNLREIKEKGEAALRPLPAGGDIHPG